MTAVCVRASAGGERALTTSHLATVARGALSDVSVVALSVIKGLMFSMLGQQKDKNLRLGSSLLHLLGHRRSAEHEPLGLTGNALTRRSHPADVDQGPVALCWSD